MPPEVDEVSRQVVDSIFSVHSGLGPGLLESAYEVCLAHELAKRELKVDRQLSLPVQYDGIRMDSGLRLDLLIESCLVVELKAVETLLPVHKAQLLTYLKLSGHRVGLLVNFNVVLIKDGIVRVVL
ncbi:MAG TPA: GxxExxY protein [Phycisphaerae bacterium]|nr:GxxExxY protein [Phycisphaerae bacterium]